MSLSVTRYTFDLLGVANTILPNGIEDCERIEMRIEGGIVVVDVVEPQAPRKPDSARAEPEAETHADNDVASGRPESAPATEEKTETEDNDTENPDEPELKGGKLAQRAAIMCNAKGFWKFLEVADAEAAKQSIYMICDIASRRELDHNEAAAAEFRNLAAEYEVWLKPPM